MGVVKFCVVDRDVQKRLEEWLTQQAVLAGMTGISFGGELLADSFDRFFLQNHSATAVARNHNHMYMLHLQLDRDVSTMLNRVETVIIETMV
jgi:hypothetical protein